MSPIVIQAATIFSNPSAIIDGLGVLLLNSTVSMEELFTVIGLLLILSIVVLLLSSSSDLEARFL